MNRFFLLAWNICRRLAIAFVVVYISTTIGLYLYGALAGGSWIPSIEAVNPLLVSGFVIPVFYDVWSGIAGFFSALLFILFVFFRGHLIILFGLTLLQIFLGYQILAIWRTG